VSLPFRQDNVGAGIPRRALETSRGEADEVAAAAQNAKARQTSVLLDSILVSQR